MGGVKLYILVVLQARSSSKKFFSAGSSYEVGPVSLTNPTTKGRTVANLTLTKK